MTAVQLPHRCGPTRAPRATEPPALHPRPRHPSALSRFTCAVAAGANFCNVGLVSEFIGAARHVTPVRQN